MTDIASNPGRRRFLQGRAAAAGVAALTGFDALAARTASADVATGSPRRGTDYGPLHPAVDGTTGEALISLPAGFRYVTFGRTGEVMDDGIPIPAVHDGMGAFGFGRYVRIVRNHEQSVGPAFATGMTYDAAAAGGTTTLRFDRLRGELAGARASLAATIRNSARSSRSPRTSTAPRSGPVPPSPRVAANGFSRTCRRPGSPSPSPAPGTGAACKDPGGQGLHCVRRLTPGPSIKWWRRRGWRSGSA